MSNFDYKPFYRRNLPHIQPPGATFFVTFHLAGSIPRSVLRQWKAEKSRLLKLQNSNHSTTPEGKTTERKDEWERQKFLKFEKTLDNAKSGPVWLKDNRIAKEIANRMHNLDGKVYRLDAYCIMANHVHVVFTPLQIQTPPVAQTKNLCYNTLSSIMQSLKGYTARKSNQILDRRGAFWHHESYDHCI